MDLTVRRLTQDDADRAWANCALFWDMSSSSEILTEFLSNRRNILLVAEYEGRPIGQIVGYILERWDAKPPMLFLYSIDVLESHRRQGVASRLIQEFRKNGRESGGGESFVFTNESNIPAMQLYTKLGGRRTHKDDVMFEWNEEIHSYAP